MADKKKFKFKLTSTHIGILVTLFIAIFYLQYDPPIFKLFERKIFDYRVRNRGIQKTSEQVVIIGIDDKSVNAFGQYPFNRGYVGEFIKILTEYYHPSVIGLDIVYADKAQDPEGDYYLGENIAFAQNVVCGMIFLFGNEYNADYNVNTSTAFRFHAKSSLISDYDYRKYVKDSVKADDLLMNLEDICYGAGGFGYLNVNQDDDGPIRSAPAAIFFKDMYFPSLPLEVARMHLKIPNEEVIVVPGHRIEIGNEIVLPTDENLNFMINYYGPFQTFKYYSFIDVMSKEIPEYELKGKIVLVGVTGTGLTDVQITPFSTEEKANLPGIEIHANIVESIISNNFFIESNSAFFVMIKFLVLILFGVIIILIISKTKFITSFVLTGITTYIYFFISQVLFNKFGLILQSIYPVMLVLMVYISVSMFKYIVEEREKRYIKKAFAYYLSPNVLKEVLANPELLKLTSKRSELTIMFIDVKSFTTYSEAHTPEEVAGNLNVLLTLMTNLVLENNGTLDKYIGDCLMGFWGAPVWFEDHAYWACKTGLLILKRIDEERKKREAEGKDFFEIGIGMNTGECVVGNMGSDMIMDYTVIGDAVNTASRVEGLTRIYDRPFVITEFTYTKVKEWAEVEELGDATVKGKTKTFKVYNLISLKEKGGKK